MSVGASPDTTGRTQPPAVPVAVPPGGLTSAEAAARLARDGWNVLPAPRPVRLWRRVAAQVRDPLVPVLLAAAVRTVATGDWADASVIAPVIVVNTAVGVTQEVKASQAIAALSQLTTPEARVLRDGEQQLIPAVGVVAGDVLVLAEWDIVPADLALQLAGLYLPFLRDLLHTQPLTLADLAVVFALSTLGYAAVRLDRLVHPPQVGAHMPGAGLGPGRSERGPAWPR